MTHNEYQKLITEKLTDIFGDEMVKSEWDSVTYDSHTHNHKSIYAPRHDVAVGPFNSFWNIDAGFDDAWKMRKHKFLKEINDKCLRHRDDLKIIWNKSSRCCLAIEIEFSSPSKHAMGTIINACASGSIGIIITKENLVQKFNRIKNYILKLEGMDNFEFNALKNLIVFTDKQFLELLKKFE